MPKMNPIKTQKFLNLITPTFASLAAEWFDPKQTPQSACLHCSVNCGRSDKHDDDCLYQIGKELMTQFSEIEQSSAYDLNFKKELRPAQEVAEIKNSYKLAAVLKRLSPDLSTYIPLDYTDPANEGVACSCGMYHTHEKSHASDCPHPQISLALADLFTA